MSDTDFLKFIFNDDTKETIVNITQFSFIAFIPIVLLVKGLNIIPEANDKKGVLENMFEIMLHLIILIVGSVIITKFALYFKPFSGTPYPEFTLYPMIISLIIVGLSFQTKLSEKVFNVKEKIFNKINSTQTPTQTTQTPTQMSQMQTMPMQQMQQMPQTPQKQQLPNYNQMYENQPIDPVNEPFASNLLGGSFGSNF